MLPTPSPTAGPSSSPTASPTPAVPTAAPSQLPSVDEERAGGKLIEEQPPPMPPPVNAGGGGERRGLVPATAVAGQWRPPPPNNGQAGGGGGGGGAEAASFVKQPVNVRFVSWISHTIILRCTPSEFHSSTWPIPLIPSSRNYKQTHIHIFAPARIHKQADPRTKTHPGDAAGSVHRGRRLGQQEQPEEEARVAAAVVAGPWRPEHPVVLPNDGKAGVEGVDGAEVAAEEARAAFVQGLVGAWDPDRRDGAVETRDVSSGGVMSSPFETRAHMLLQEEAEEGAQPLLEGQELALEIEAQEEQGGGGMPASEGAAARDGWFEGLPYPVGGEEAEDWGEDEGAGLVGVVKGEEPRVAATAIAGQWHPEHVVPPPQTSANPDGTFAVRIRCWDEWGCVDVYI